MTLEIPLSVSSHNAHVFQCGYERQAYSCVQGISRELQNLFSANKKIKKGMKESNKSEPCSVHTTTVIFRAHNNFSYLCKNALQILTDTDS